MLEDEQPEWYPFAKGNTINTRGSENGIVLIDTEHPFGARITLEQKDSGRFPFVVFLVIYGVMFHTHFESDLALSHEYINNKKVIINKIFAIHEIPEKERTNEWLTTYNNLKDELADNL